MKEARNPFAVTQSDGASLLNQFGFFLVMAPAIAVSRKGLSGLVCLTDDGLRFLAFAAAECFSTSFALVFAFGLCALVGALGGGLFGAGRAPLAAGVAGGALACLGGALVTHLALQHREFFTYPEAVLSWAIGAGPGVLLYKALVETREGRR